MFSVTTWVNINSAAFYFRFVHTREGSLKLLKAVTCGNSEFQSLRWRYKDIPSCLIFQMPQSHTDEKTTEPRATWQRLAAALPGSPTQIDYRSRWRSATVFSFQMSLMRHPPCCLFTNSSSLWHPNSFFFFFRHRFHWTAQLSASLLAEMAENPCQNLFWQQRLKYTFFLNGT